MLQGSCQTCNNRYWIAYILCFGKFVFLFRDRRRGWEEERWVYYGSEILGVRLLKTIYDVRCPRSPGRQPKVQLNRRHGLSLTSDHSRCY